MTYYLIAGEASGDLHASNLMKALQEQDPNSKFRFWGGDLMASIGGKPVVHYNNLSYMGFWEVLKNIRSLNQYIKYCKKDIADTKPDALILVDYAGFNLKIAAFAKKVGIPVHFYIAPKVWAWNEKRVEKLRQYVDYLYVIFPFEKQFFENKHKLPVCYVGNPLQDVIINRKKIDATTFKQQYQLNDKNIIALLPGSRQQEITHILPLMSQMAEVFLDYQFVIAGAPNKPLSFYKPYITSDKVAFVPNKTYDLLSISHAALVTSGTATLETALFNIPQVVCYHTSKLSYLIGKILVKNIKYISLVNLVLDRLAVVELIQNDFNLNRLKLELDKILSGNTRNNILHNYTELNKKLGTQGASVKVACNILKSLNNDE